MVASSSNFYQLGASLPVDAKSYVQRQADEEFYQKLRNGKFCYVLNSRQMGKSSLRVQTMQRLSHNRYLVAVGVPALGGWDTAGQIFLRFPLIVRLERR